jgi:hypothetical protein
VHVVLVAGAVGQAMARMVRMELVSVRVLRPAVTTTTFASVHLELKAKRQLCTVAAAAAVVVTPHFP